ncbi:MAG: DUF4139 domain-containing protein [Acidobacteriota bacterium]
MVVPMALCLTLLLTPVAAAPGDSSLPPLREITLYKSGVGFFVHRGNVALPASLRLLVPDRSLDDVLKSLTISGIPGAHLDAVTYPSRIPAERSLAELPFDLAGTQNLVQVLQILRGTSVAVRSRSGQPIAEGRILDAEYRSSEDGGSQILLGLWAPSGQIRVVPLDESVFLAVQDPRLQDALDAYLGLRADEHTTRIRSLEIRFGGEGSSPVELSYLMEAPVWKTTYRLVVKEQGSADLYAWALVDNTTPYDWEGVSLALVAGAPISFRQPLSTAIFVERPLVAVPQAPTPKPPVHEGALPESEKPEDTAQFQAARRLPGGIPGGVVGGAPARALQPMKALAAEAVTFPTETTESGRLGDHFRYRLERPLSLERNRSAAVALLQAEVPVELVSVYRPDSPDRHPYLAVLLNNATDWTLDGGTFHVVRDGAFAGEGLLETLQPREQRLLSYGVDLAVEVTREPGEAPRHETVRWTASQGVITLQRREWIRSSYRLANRDTQARNLLLEHTKRPGFQLGTDSRPEEESASYYRFRVEVPANASRTLTVAEYRTLEERVELQDWPADSLAGWIEQQGKIPEAVRAQLGEILRMKREVARLESQLGDLRRQIDGIFSDQARLRENLGRLGDSPAEGALKSRYLEKLSAQEDELEQLGSRVKEVENQLKTAQAELQRRIESLEGSWE